MSTPGLPFPGAAPGAAPPPVPPGWLANWSLEHSAWFYVFTATGATQWEYPTAPSERPEHSPPLDQPSHPLATDSPVQDGDRGLGKTALALGGGYLAGSASGHMAQEHHHHGLGKIAKASASAIGAKILGRFGNKPQQHHQSSPPPPQTHVHFTYPVYGPGPQGNPSQTPSYYGQPAPEGQNCGHFAGDDTSGVAPDVMFPQLHHHGGVHSPATGAIGAFTSHSAPPLHIHGAVFADKDVTQIVQSLVTPQQTLTLTGDTLVEKLGDPWPEVERKMFNVVYSYGDRPMELLAAETSMSNIEIKNEAISRKRMEFCQPLPSRIIACVWGLENPLTAPRLEQLEKDGEMEGSGAVFGGGGFWDWEPKTLVCYYRTETGGVGIVYCRDGGTIRLPWNPLAKWS